MGGALLLALRYMFNFFRIQGNAAAAEVSVCSTDESESSEHDAASEQQHSESSHNTATRVQHRVGFCDIIIS